MARTPMTEFLEQMRMRLRNEGGPVARCGRCGNWVEPGDVADDDTHERNGHRCGEVIVMEAAPEEPKPEPDPKPEPKRKRKQRKADEPGPVVCTMCEQPTDAPVVLPVHVDPLFGGDEGAETETRPFCPSCAETWS